MPPLNASFLPMYMLASPVEAALSSVYSEVDTAASHCIDGDLRTVCGSAESTAGSNWAAVRLSPGARVALVAIYNRRDFYDGQPWFGTVEVWLGSSAGDTSADHATRCGTASYDASVETAPYVISCGGRSSGEWVTVHQTACYPSTCFLVLSEIETYIEHDPPAPPAPPPMPDTPPSAPLPPALPPPSLPPPYAPIVSPMDRMVHAFNTNGWLTKVTGCHGQFCSRGVNLEEAHAWLWNALVATDRPPNVVERDCGDRCSAMAFLSADLPVTPFSWRGYRSGLMLVFDARPRLWRHHVQCMSTADSFTTSRVCCTCGDPRNCPWGIPHNEGVYCSADCDHDPTCKQLAAGCGVSLFDLAHQSNGGDGNGAVGRRDQTDWGDRGCSEWDVRSGSCAVCRQPYWCNANGTANPLGTIRTPQQWNDAFFDNDGGRAFGSRQCKWRPSEKQTFIDTMRMRFERRARNDNDDHANVWNEVSFYTPSDASLNNDMWDSLIGLVYVESAGNDYERRKVLELAAHWRSLGYDVPTFEMTAEDIEWCCGSQHWRSDQRVDLTARPYNLRQMFA